MIAPHEDPGRHAAARRPIPLVPVSRAARRFLWIFSVVMLAITSSAFIFKLIEFAYSFVGDQSLHVAIVPVLTYLIVAAGFACLFFWAYLTGQFKNVEAPKYRMLEMQDEIDAKEGLGHV